MYRKLSQGATVVHSRDLWTARLPLKIKIFTWQLALDRLPTSTRLAKRLARFDGKCAVCGEEEDASHIFFSCVLAKLGWSVVRRLLGCSWCPANFPQFFSIHHSLLGQKRRISWVLFSALCWTLWITRNKLAIESKVPKHPADIIYKMTMFLQVWANLSKQQDKERLLLVVRDLKEIYSNLAPPRQS